ncbi:MAG: M1 family metallopeptidase [Saprospiraceae bacterium]|nr:M1 family metallopeptidase [Saprospiraceae bacterium]
MKYLSLVIFSVILFGACTGSKLASKSVVRPEEGDTAGVGDIEYRQLDPLVVTPEEEEETMITNEPVMPYRSAYTRRWDLIHTSLQLKFDWEKEHVIGLATLKLVPLFYTTDTVQLDAKTFDFNSITASGKTLNYTYDGNMVTIHLGKKYTRTDTLLLSIDYTAKPSENTTRGSAAITDDNGLYFIDPRSTDPKLPTQLWSQGETENNSHWMPTIDKPNERMTIDITLTVPDSMLTLSNGLMTKTSKNTDHTRTDTWVMDQPIAPYLVMIAAGPFARVTDKWNDIPLEYYVDKPYASYAKDIFNHTPEMLSFFSEKLGVQYPWKKFSQIIVKKYVSGAMENTTAVVFGDFIEKTRRELIDDPNDKIVAHEMFHHWFGDYVTCESWSNLTLNEGFANYAEYLWSEYKYGRYEADRHREEELSGYISSVSFGQPHNLIDFRYTDKENMFDAHSYNKGGLVLHMLRSYLGDEAFYAGLHHYLVSNAYKSVEVHHLRLAFEEVTGEDLNWFFNQWYLDDGHPNLTYAWSYDRDNKKIIIDLKQTQDKTFPNPFILPMDLDIHHADGTKERIRITMDQREQQIDIPCDANPQLVVLDPNRVILTEWNEAELTSDQYKYQWRNCNNLQLKLNALSALTEDKDYHTVWGEAIKDPFWYIRLRAMDYTPKLDKTDVEQLVRLTSEDPHSQVRAAALRILGEADYKSIETIADQRIASDSAYAVISQAMQIMGQVNPSKAKSLAMSMQKEKNDQIQEAIADIITTDNDPSSLDFIENKLIENPAQTQNLMEKYIMMLSNQSPDIIFDKAGFLFKQAMVADLDKNNKFLYTRGLFELKDLLLTDMVHEKDSATKSSLESKVNILKSWIQQIKEKETDIQLKDLLKQFN